jgi:deoxyribonuclease V
VDEARAVQASLRRRVVAGDRLGPVRRVAGVDAAYERAHGRTRAAAAVLELADLAPVEVCTVEHRTRFPYVPGYLAFRELPSLVAALARLRAQPDVVLCDAHGLAHPRRFGLACHLGVVLDIPTIGVAKSRLVGTHGLVPRERGRWVPLVDGEEVIGAVVRTRSGVRPVYVSIGHRVGLEHAVALVLRCTARYRLPEPLRQAHARAAR